MTASYVPNIVYEYSTACAAFIAKGRGGNSASTSASTGVRPSGVATGPASKSAWTSTSGSMIFGNGVYTMTGGWNQYSGFPYFIEFNQGASWVAGQGKDNTWIEPTASSMSASTISYYDSIPGLPSPGTNNLGYFRWDHANISNITIHATPQQRYSHCVYMYQPNGLTHHDLRVKGVAGVNAYPPGECFSWNEYGATNTTFNNVEFDGTDDSGKRVASSILGINSSHGGMHMNDSYLHGSRWGYGVAFWHSQGLYTFTRTRFEDTLVPINLEGMSNASIVFASCTFKNVLANPNKVHMRILCDLGTASITFIDPVFDSYSPYTGQIVIGIFPGKPYTSAQQATGMIRVIQNGMDTTATTLKILSSWNNGTDGGTG